MAVVPTYPTEDSSEARTTAMPAAGALTRQEYPPTTFLAAWRVLATSTLDGVWIPSIRKKQGTTPVRLSLRIKAYAK